MKMNACARISCLLATVLALVWISPARADLGPVVALSPGPIFAVVDGHPLAAWSENATLRVQELDPVTGGPVGAPITVFPRNGEAGGVSLPVLAGGSDVVLVAYGLDDGTGGARARRIRLSDHTVLDESPLVFENAVPQIQPACQPSSVALTTPTLFYSFPKFVIACVAGKHMALYTVDPDTGEVATLPYTPPLNHDLPAYLYLDAFYDEILLANVQYDSPGLGDPSFWVRTTMLTPDGTVLFDTQLPQAGNYFAAIGHTDSEFLVAFTRPAPGGQSVDVVGARISTTQPNPALLDTVPFLIGSDGGFDSPSAVVFDGERFVVSWQTGASGSGAVRAAFVDTNGHVLDPAGLALASPADESFGGKAAFSAAPGLSWVGWILHVNNDVTPQMRSLRVGNAAVAAPCTTGSECATGYCFDGVCCDTWCAGCSACSAAHGAIADGTCTPLGDGGTCEMADAGADGGDAGAPDAGAPDASAADASAPDASAPDGGEGGSAPAPSDGGGCACNAVGGAASGPLALALLLLANARWVAGRVRRGAGRRARRRPTRDAR